MSEIIEGPERSELGKQYDKYQEGIRIGFSKGQASKEAEVNVNAKKAKAWDELIDFMQDRQGQPMWLAMERMSELMKEKP